jgi:hypothetical protein
LIDGLTPVQEVQKQARSNGIAPRTLRRAAERLQVIRKKGTGNAWYWKLPNTSLKADDDDSQKKVVSNLANRKNMVMLAKMKPSIVINLQAVMILLYMLAKMAKI